MKFFRIDLLTLLISLFILNSCKNENVVGLAPGNQTVSGTIDDTATVYTNTVAEDSIATSTITKVPLGYTIDPILGTTESDLITDINLPGNDATSGNVAYTLPTGTITIDSALLVLKYADGFYGDPTLNYTVNVYQLNERMYGTNIYYDNKRWNYNAGNVIGSLTFQPRPLDSVKVDTIVHGAKDTLVKDAPAIRIPLSKSFIQDNLFRAGSVVLASNLIFENTVKGFFINVNQSTITSTGGTMMFQAPADNAVVIYYRATNGSVVDTNLVTLNVTQHATQINHVFSAQVQNSLALTAQNAATNSNKPDNFIYLQAGGLRSKVSFPYLKSLFSNIPGGISNVVINRAELVITDTTAGESANIPALLVPAPKLTLYRYDITHQPYTVEDATLGGVGYFNAPEFGGYYNGVTNSKSYRTYHFLITGYLQSILSGATVDYGTYVGVVDTTNTSSVDIAPTIQTAARTIGIGGANKASTGRIKLNVIYTRTKQ